MKNLLSMRDLSKEDILYFIDIATKIENGNINVDLKGKLAALLFFEPSTRTHFSFETAMKKLGGETFSMMGTDNTSVQKGETFKDTLKVVSNYADILVIRSKVEGAPRYASEVVEIPVVNAGDGANQHPSQALLDLYSIQKTQHTLKDLTIGLVGDLRLGRTVHSLAQAMSDFNPKFYLASPYHLRMPDSVKNDLTAKGVHFEEVDSIESVVNELDVMYVTRIQRERFAIQEDYDKVKDSYVVTKSMLQNVKENLKILHPLPRVNEINTEVDDTPYAYYFEQARNGVFMRQAIFSILLGAIK